MPKKPAETTQKPIKDRAVDAAFDLAARIGWDMVTMTDIAEEAQVSLADLSDHFDDKSDILVTYGRRIDRKVLEAVGAASPDETPRDRLFEILMERFDLLNDDKESIISILSSFKLDPKQAVISLPHLGRSMAWTLEAAGIETTGIKGAIRVAGLVGFYLNAVRVWMSDDSGDMAKTMASLDKGLNRAESLANNFML